MKEKEVKNSRDMLGLEPVSLMIKTIVGIIFTFNMSKPSPSESNIL